MNESLVKIVSPIPPVGKNHLEAKWYFPTVGIGVTMLKGLPLFNFPRLTIRIHVKNGKKRALLNK